MVFRWASFGLSSRGELFPSSALALQGMLHSLRPSHLPLSDQISTLWLSHRLSSQPCSLTSPGSISCFLFGLSVYKPNSGLTSLSTILTRWPLILIFLQQHPEALCLLWVSIPSSSQFLLSPLFVPSRAQKTAQWWSPASSRFHSSNLSWSSPTLTHAFI